MYMEVLMGMEEVLSKYYTGFQINYGFMHIFQLGDNCIVFENFTASIIDLMV